MSEKKKEEPRFRFGPFEQALTVLVVMGFASNPSLTSYNPFSPHYSPSRSQYGVPGGAITNIPLFTPPMIILVLIAYIGYHLLARQAAKRDHQKALSKSKSSSSSSRSSSSKPSSAPLTSTDIRSAGMPSSSSSKSTGDPAPKQVSGKSAIDPKKDPSSSAFRKNYFLTMQGPGRPALVPFQDGLRPAKGDAEGTMWWNNIPDDAKDLMAPPIDPAKQKEMMKNPWKADMVGKDIELLKLKKQQKEEEERFEKVASLLQTILGFLLCAVDMRLGVVAIVFFLWKHFSNLQAKDLADDKDAIENEKKELTKQISEAKKAGASSSEIQRLQQEISRL
ncbi:hypothetical protein P7C73_g5404, partial [Tremellales sp. Uapishka_1]